MIQEATQYPPPALDRGAELLKSSMWPFSTLPLPLNAILSATLTMAFIFIVLPHVYITI